MNNRLNTLSLIVMGVMIVMVGITKQRDVYTFSNRIGCTYPVRIYRGQGRKKDFLHNGKFYNYGYNLALNYKAG